VLAASATRRHREAALELRRWRRDLGLSLQPGVPFDRAGLVGSELTPLVTTLGSLDAKIVAASPAWAGELVHRLAGAGVGQGDVGAAAFSGSFPGLDLATVIACNELGAELVAISSVTASTWGATDAGLTWPEMEARLATSGRIDPVTIAVAIGGDNDRGDDLDEAGLALATTIQARTAAMLGAEALRAADLEAACRQRLQLYGKHAAGRPVALFVSVGGAHASLGGSPTVLRLRSGFIPGQPFDLSPERGLIARFTERGVPVLLLLNVRDLAARWRVD